MYASVCVCVCVHVFLCVCVSILYTYVSAWVCVHGCVRVHAYRRWLKGVGVSFATGSWLNGRPPCGGSRALGGGEGPSPRVCAEQAS